MITFDFQTHGTEANDAYIDSYELTMLFENTRQELGRALERKLHALTCEQHSTEAQVHIVGHYDFDSEQMDIQYHIEACCAPFRLRVIQAISRVG
jgi:hypothetical protein